MDSPMLLDDQDDASSLASEVVKPKTTKAKVAKPKVVKPKVEKPKVEKVKKEVVKKEKVEGAAAAPKKRKIATSAAASPDADGEGDFDDEDEEAEVKVKKPAPKKRKTATEAELDGDSAGDEEPGVKKKVVKKAAVKKDTEKPKLDKDGKEKVKAVTGDEAVQMMLVYLKEQNRPYSATEVSANLHGKVTKTVADKLLKEMENNGQIQGKATKKDGGGQWVFWTIQDAADAASPEELAAMDTEITTLKESLPPLKASFKTLTGSLQAALSAPTTAELIILIQKLQVDNAAKAEKLKGFQDGSIKMVTKEDLDRTEKEYKYWNARRGARVRAQKDLLYLLKDYPDQEKLADMVEEDPYSCGVVGK